MDNSLSRKRPDLIAEWSPRNLPLTPDRVSYGSNKVYWWIGACGHEWQTSAKARSAGEKCPICSNARIIPGVNDLETLEPELAKEWSEKNYPLMPSQVGPGTHKKVFWLGKCGHEWSAVVRNRVKGAGCPYCSHNIVLPGFNDLESFNPQLAAEWSEKNLPLLPSQVTAYANRKVWWKCSQGHEWNALISTRSYGSRCPYCTDILTLRGYNDFATRYPELTEEWSDRNKDLKPYMVNNKCRLNVWWKCKKCGYEWRSLVKSRVKGSACPVCSERATLAGYNDLATTDPLLVREWDCEKNGDVIPSSLSRYSMRYVWWRCEFGHSWRGRVSDRTIEGESCRICEDEFSSYLPILLIMLYSARRKLRATFDDEKTIGVKLDAYLPELGLAICVIEKETKENRECFAVARHLCDKRGITLKIIAARKDHSDICIAVKEAFQSVHIYIASDNESDIQIAREKYDLLKRKQGQRTDATKNKFPAGKPDH